jgi:prephenate dehydrogenase
MLTITLIGLGRLGTSLGLALKRKDDIEMRIIGHDLLLENAKQAEKQGAIDKAEWNLPASCEDADVIFLCVPLSALREVIEQVAPLAKEGAVIADLSPLKACALEWASELIPGGRYFVSTYPALNPSYLYDGDSTPRADLFESSVWALVAGADTSPEAVKLVGGVAQLAGAIPFFIGADEFDSLSSATNTLPTLAAASLMLTLGRSSSWGDARKIADRSFATATAPVEMSNPESAASAATLNRASTLHDLDALITQLKSLRDLVANGDAEKLASLMEESAAIRRAWLEKRRAANWAAEEMTRTEMPKASDFLKQFIGIGKNS